MAWIRVIEEREADSELSAIYEQVKGRRGKLSNIMAVHSLLPQTMRVHMDLYLAVMFDSVGLSREEREMVAVAVSTANRCPYCINHHAQALRHYWNDEERLIAFVADHRSADISPRMHAVLDYADRLTRTPQETVEGHVRVLRDHGLTDEEILSLNLIVSYFNFVNRIALGLGVEFSADEIRGYRY